MPENVALGPAIATTSPKYLLPAISGLVKNRPATKALPGNILEGPSADCFGRQAAARATVASSEGFPMNGADGSAVASAAPLSAPILGALATLQYEPTPKALPG